MKNKQRDQLLADALREGTEGAARQKDRVWRAVYGQISSEKRPERNIIMMRRKNRWLAGAVAAAAVLGATVFFSLTPQGTALADRIITFFAPEKQMQTQIEGDTKTHEGTLQGNTSQEMGYVIYIDAERYRKESAGGTDYYKVLDFPEGYPPVQMEISQRQDESAENAYQRLLAESKNEFEIVEGKGRVTEPVQGWFLFAYDDGGGEAPYEEVYVVDNTQGGSFVIRCRMFREATEGHGARFAAMLRTFEVVDSSQLNTEFPTVTTAPQAAALTWDDLALFGAKLDDGEEDAIQAISAAFEGNAEADETKEDAGGKTRTLHWHGGTTAVIRNGKLYSIETAETAALPNGLHAGMKLADFTARLGEPREAIGALAWGVGSNDNLFAVVEDGVVTAIKISLIE